MSLKIEKVGEKFQQQDPMMAKMAEGKTLNCAIPVEVVEYNQDQYIDEILNAEEKFDQYCSGPIKDALKEAIREKTKND